MWESCTGLSRCWTPTKPLAAPGPPSACSLWGVKSAPFFGGGVPAWLAVSLWQRFDVGAWEEFKVGFIKYGDPKVWVYPLNYSERLERLQKWVPSLVVFLRNKWFLFHFSICRPSEYNQFFQKKRPGKLQFELFVLLMLFQKVWVLMEKGASWLLPGQQTLGDSAIADPSNSACTP